MEENNNNNNNGNKVVEQGKQIAKDAVKSAVKKPVKKIVITALPYIGIFILILLIVGVINAMIYLVQSWFASLFNPTSASSSSSSANAQIQSVISIDEDGKYVVKADEFAEMVKTNFEEKKIDLEDLEIVTDDLGNLIEKYVEAEFKTMLPKINNGWGFDGNVVIKRMKAGSLTATNLNYIKYEEFMTKINNQDETVLNDFSINPENFNLMIAEQRGNVQYYYDYDKSIIDTKTVSSKITISGDEEEGIDYLTLIQNYGAPFNFFLSMHMVALDAEFMNDLVNMVLDDNKPIILTYIDNATTETIVYDHTGKSTDYIHKDIYENTIEGWVRDAEKNKGPDEVVETINITNDNVEQIKEKYPNMPLNEYWKIENTHSSGKLYITSADTWLKQTEKKVENKNPSSEEKNSTDPYTETTARKRDGNETTDENTRIVKWTYSKLEDYVETATRTSELKAHTVVDVENKIKVQEFIDFIKKYPGVVDNIKSAPSQILYSLEQDESTQKLSKVMRYVLLHLTGTDYGITTEEEIERLLRDATEYSVIKGDSTENFIKAWENDQLWIYETGQSNTIPTEYLTEDGLNYIVYEDEGGSAGHNNIAYGCMTFCTNSDTSPSHPDYANHPIYGVGHYNWKDEFAAQEIYVETLYEGALVDKEKAIAVFQHDIIPFFKNKVDDYLETNLPEYEITHEQRDALISICYQYGNISGFADAYTSSLNDDGTINAEAIRTNYSRFDYSSEFADRQYANWLLFTEGVYIDRLGNEIAMGGRIVTTAYQVGEYFINCVNGDVWYAGESVYANDPENQHKRNGIIVVGGDVKASYENAYNIPSKYGIVCATFVTFALWQSGLVDEATINNYGYHGCCGVEDMLNATGEWELVPKSDVREGDIVFEGDYGHVYIFIDGNKKLDQTYCVLTSLGDDLRGTLRDADINNIDAVYRYVGKN